jgi:hypothetical protein
VIEHAHSRLSNEQRPKSHVIQALRQTDIDQQTIDALERQLPDPVDLDRDGNLLLAYGITRDRLIDRAGGSP